MDLALIEKLMRMLEVSALEELDVTEGEMRIRLAKRRAVSASVFEKTDRQPSMPAVADEVGPGLHRIVSGLAGAFYRSPSPDTAPFVTEGSHVRDGDTLAIIEAMKLFNPVEADCDGVIRRIAIDNGGSVEPGMVLFEIEADAP